MFIELSNRILESSSNKSMFFLLLFCFGFSFFGIMFSFPYLSFLSLHNCSLFFSKGYIGLMLFSILFDFTNILLYYGNFFFIWYSFIVFLGLGFSSKLFSKKDSGSSNFYLYVGDSHWLVIKICEELYMYNISRRNFVLFSKSKFMIRSIVTFFKQMDGISFSFKLKGFLDSSMNRRWLMVKRLTLKALKSKLSKKQVFV